MNKYYGKYITRTFLIFFILNLLMGCGQSGNLYLPKKNASPTKPLNNNEFLLGS